MSITGNLKTMQLAELLQWLSQSQKSGTLVINGPRVEKRIFFREGKIVSSASTDPGEYLGHFLVSHDFITEEQLTEAVRQQESQKMLLGKILVTSGVVTEQNLHRILRLKAEESIYDVFTWPEGEFRFLDGALPEFTMIPIQMDVTGIMMEGARRVDEWRRIRELIPSKDAIPVSIVPLEDPNLDPTAQKILQFIDDERTVEEIRLEALCSEFQVSTVLFKQAQGGRIKVVKPRFIRVEVQVEREPESIAVPPQAVPLAAVSGNMFPTAATAQQIPQAQPLHAVQPPPGMAHPQYPTAPNPNQGVPIHHPSAGGMPPGGAYHQQSPPLQRQPSGAHPILGGAAPISDTVGVDQLDANGLLESAREAIARRDLDQCLRHLKAVRTLDPNDPKLQSSVKSVEEQMRQLVGRSGVKPSSIPRLTVPMEELMGLNVSAQEGFILTRVDGSYDIKSIVKISPISEIEALVLFWRMAEAGHVRV